MKYKIPVFAHLCDNGDGSNSVYIFNTLDELFAEVEEYDDEGNQIPLTEERRKEILNQEDPYEDGIVEEGEIEVEIVDGVARLTKSFGFSG